MKKLFLTLVAAIVAVTATVAQNTLVATLSHGSEITMYYGTNALRDAYNVAVSGDVINLSGGGFQAVEIQKTLTIRGTGIEDANPTMITGTGNTTLFIGNTGTGRLIMEGITFNCREGVNMYGTINNLYFVKCKFNKIGFHSSATINNATFINCKITESYNCYGSNPVVSSQFINSYVYRFTCSQSSSASFINCVVSGIDVNSMNCSQFYNSVLFYNGNSSLSLPSSSIATNCVAIGLSQIFNNSQTNPGCMTATFEEVFKDFTGTYSSSQTFELTDEAKNKLLGTDGTQVGLYGGVMPYTSIPSYPRITKMNVANKTTADGKLSVDIEVSAAQ